MIDETTYQKALERLRTVHRSIPQDADLSHITANQEKVMDTYQRVFSKDNIDSLTEETMRGFLSFDNNCHWSSLDRLAPITWDMGELRYALNELVDESIPIKERIDSLVPHGTGRIPRLSKAVLTPILLLSYPDKYGVWNGVSERGLSVLDIYPADAKGKSFGEKYEILNKLFNRLANDLGIDLWTLDALWWRIADPI